MSVDIQWNDADPETGEKRFVCVEKFAREFKFFVRFKRRENWQPPAVVSLEMWEELLDSLERRYQRREGVSDEDLAVVRAEVNKLKQRQAVVKKSEEES